MRIDEILAGIGFSVVFWGCAGTLGPAKPSKDGDGRRVAASSDLYEKFDPGINVPARLTEMDKDYAEKTFLWCMSAPRSTKSTTIPKRPNRDANISAVLRVGDSLSILAFLSSKTASISKFPRSDAHISVVSPDSSCSSTFAPLSNKALTIFESSSFSSSDNNQLPEVSCERKCLDARISEVFHDASSTSTPAHAIHRM
jgi:hypothetical protein